MTSKLSISSYLHLIPCARTETFINKHGTRYEKKLSSLSIAWDHTRLFFYRLTIFAFKTHKWPNVKWVSEAVIGDLKKISKGFKSEFENEHPKLPACYSLGKIESIERVFERLQTVGAAQENLNKIKKALEKIKANVNHINTPFEPSPPSSPTPSPTLLRDDHPLRFPIKKGIALDVLTPGIRKEYGERIRHELEKNPRDKRFFLEADKRFDDSWQRALTKTPDLHQEFQSQFDPFSEICLIEVEDQPLIKASLYQFQNAIQVVKKHFPHLTSLAYNNVQRIKVARLIQIILIGKDHLPESELCFTLSELYQDKEQFKESEEHHIPLQSTLLDLQFKRTSGSRPGKDTWLQFRENLVTGIKLFTQDFLERSEGFVVEIQHERLALDDTLFDKIRNLYEQYLYENPEETIQIIKNIDKNITLRNILNFFPQTGLSANFLDEILDELITKYRDSEDQKRNLVCERLIQLKENTRFSPDMMKKIADASGHSEELIEPLMRIKFIELMLILNQSISFYPYEQINNTCQKASQDIPGGVTSRARSIKFLFEKNLTDFETHIRYPVKMNSCSPENAFANDLDFAEMSAVLKYASSNLAVIGCSYMKFGWIAPLSAWAKLAEQIEPNIHKMQPLYLEEKHAENLDTLLENLSVITEIKDGQDIQENNEKKFEMIKLTGWFGHKKDPNPQNLEALNLFFDDLFESFKTYKDICKRADNEKKAFKLFEKVLPKGLEGLSILQKTYGEKEGHIRLKEIHERVQKEYQNLITPSVA